MNHDDQWRTSSFTNGAATCVEVKVGRRHVGVRDSKDQDRDRRVLTLPTSSWHDLLAHVNN